MNDLGPPIENCLSTIFMLAYTTGNKTFDKMAKKQIRIEALAIAGTILQHVEVTLWDDEEIFSEEDQCKIVSEINRIGKVLLRKEERLKV